MVVVRHAAHNRKPGLGVAHYDPATGERVELRTVPVSRSGLTLWRVTPGGESVVATDRTTGEFVTETVTLQVIDLTTGAGGPLPGNHTGGVAGVAVSPDGRWLASADGLEVVRVWSLCHHQLLKQFWARGTGVESLTLRPSARHLATVGTDGWVRLWDLAAVEQRD